jgi:hypothetical protein
MEKILPTIIMIEMFAASIPYFFQGKIGSGLYWLAAGLISFAIAFLIPRFG